MLNVNVNIYFIVDFIFLIITCMFQFLKQIGYI